MHRAYAKHPEVTVPSLDDWEKGWQEKLKAETLKPEMPMPKVLPVNFRSVPVGTDKRETVTESLAHAEELLRLVRCNDKG